MVKSYSVNSIERDSEQASERHFRFHQFEPVKKVVHCSFQIKQLDFLNNSGSNIYKKILLHHYYVVVVQLKRLWEKIEKHESTYLSIFKQDPAFGMKIAYQVDRCLQVFLSSFSEGSYLNYIDINLV